MKKKHFIKLVFEATGIHKCFLVAYEKIQGEAYLNSKLVSCYCSLESVNNPKSRLEIIFNDLDETGYRDLWKLLGTEITMYSVTSESNLMLSLF